MKLITTIKHIEMITDEQITAKAMDCLLIEETAKWVRDQMVTEISFILIDCYMLGEVCKHNKKVLIPVEKMLDLFKRKGYEPELPF